MEPVIKYDYFVNAVLDCAQKIVGSTLDLVDFRNAENITKYFAFELKKKEGAENEEVPATDEEEIKGFDCLLRAYFELLFLQNEIINRVDLQKYELSIPRPIHLDSIEST